MNKTIAKLAALAAIPIGLCTAANAQSVPLAHTAPTNLAFAYGTSHETWHTVLLISGVVLLAGLINSDSGLIIIGGAGVLLAESETNGTAFRQSVHSLDFAKLGRVSVVIDPFGSMGYVQGLSKARPGLVFQTKIKF